jgi:lipoprotein-anchoring transpeptidase ErfK/SrfK
MNLQKGISHLVTLVVIFSVLVLLASPARRYIYWTYQHLGFNLGINFNNIASEKYVSWIKSQSGELENSQSAVFLNKKVDFRDTVANVGSNILGQTTGDDNKWIEIDLSEQRLYMREGDRAVGSFLVSTGKWSPTPQGEGRIWTKLRYTRMTGGSKALGTFYDLPNVPYVMYYDRGYGIHGAYWHNNFGQPMSHGCTNMRPEEAGIVFNWASVGTKVVVRQ